MTVIHDYLIDNGFQIVEDQKSSAKEIKFLFTYKIEGFANYTVLVTSYTNWFFSMEIEKLSQSNSVVGFSRYTCFKGIISSENSIEILEVIFKATGINTILKM